MTPLLLFGVHLMSSSLTAAFISKDAISPSRDKMSGYTELCHWLDPALTNTFPQLMASSAGLVPKVPQTLFLNWRAMRNRHRNDFPQGITCCLSLWNKKQAFVSLFIGFWPRAGRVFIPQIGKLNVAPLCFSCLSVDRMNPPQAQQANPSSEAHSCAPWSSWGRSRTLNQI